MGDNMDSKLFLDFIMSYGFNPENYDGILELFSKVEDSMSRELIDYNQFLLSRNVQYSELENYGIEGADGYLGRTGIIINSENDSLLSMHRIPDMSDFGVIIGNGLHNDIINVPNFNHDNFLGACLDFDDDRLEDKIQVYEDVAELFNMHSGERYHLAYDVDSVHGKKLLLITKAPVKILVKEKIHTSSKIR